MSDISKDTKNPLNQPFIETAGSAAGGGAIAGDVSINGASNEVWVENEKVRALSNYSQSNDGECCKFLKFLLWPSTLCFSPLLMQYYVSCR
jgi:hypothetical protein